MKFLETPLQGVYLIELDPAYDDRGFFARTWCKEEFQKHGLNPNLAQCSLSFNKKKGTLRGMHYQCEPHQEAKLVRCCAGAIHDVVLDLRRGSHTFGKWFAAELNAGNHKMLYVPEGCAHGFLSLQDESAVFYQISESYHPESARGIRWNDPVFAIKWPIATPILSDRDRSFPDYRP
jgi:dTDP-4-dehydrorhamnose 3,5-epimerase